LYGSFYFIFISPRYPELGLPFSIKTNTREGREKKEKKREHFVTVPFSATDIYVSLHSFRSCGRPIGYLSFISCIYFTPFTRSIMGFFRPWPAFFLGLFSL